jgi:hypothetical protein
VVTTDPNGNNPEGADQVNKRKRRSGRAFDRHSDSIAELIRMSKRDSDREQRWNRDDYPPGPRDDARMYEVMWRAVERGMIAPTNEFDNGQRVWRSLTYRPPSP